MAFSTAFEPAGRYAGLFPKFSPGINLGKNLTTMERPLNQETSGSGFPTGFSLGENLTTPLGQQAIDYMNIGGPTPGVSKLEDWLGRAIERSLDPNARKEDLANKLAYDKEQMKQAFPYLMAREIPRQISEGFGNAAMIRVLGARNASEAMNQTLASYPRLNLQATSFQPQKYFS